MDDSVVAAAALSTFFRGEQQHQVDTPWWDPHASARAGRRRDVRHAPVVQPSCWLAGRDMQASQPALRTGAPMADLHPRPTSSFAKTPAVRLTTSG